jgi:hypothetical protein
MAKCVLRTILVVTAIRLGAIPTKVRNDARRRPHFDSRWTNG